MTRLVDRALSPDDLCVVVKSHAPMAYQRMSLLEQTLGSVKEAFAGSHLFLLCNGSEDGSFDAQCDLVDQHGFHLCIGTKWFCDDNLNDWLGADYASAARSGTSPGHGAHRAAAVGSGHELVVFSDDDMVWHADAGERLVRAWQDAPSDLLVISGLLEPVWEHNRPIEVAECGLKRDERVLVRQSVPGAAWSFRSCRWPDLADVLPTDFGYDTRTCEALRELGYRVGALDLCEHAGAGASTHGNNAIVDLPGSPLDRGSWGV